VRVLPVVLARPKLFFSGRFRYPTILSFPICTIENHHKQQKWAKSRRRESLAKPRTLSPEPKPYENSKSASPISENSASGKESTLGNHETRRKPRNPQPPRPLSTTQRISNTCFTSRCCRSLESRRLLRRRSRKL